MSRVVGWVIGGGGIAALLLLLWMQSGGEARGPLEDGTRAVDVPGTAADRPRLAEILTRWNTRLADLGDISEEERDREVPAFLRSVPWTDLAWLCGEGQSTVTPDSIVILQSMTRYRLESDWPDIEVLAALIECPTCLLACKGPVLAWEMVMHDSLAAADRERLALAMLRGADGHDLQIQMRRRMLTGVARTSVADTVMTVMMAKARSGGRDDVRLGLHMLGTSVDARAPDSLATLLREFHAADSPHVGSALNQCRDRCAELSAELLTEIYHAAGDDRERRSAFFAMARASHPDVARAMLQAYPDAAGIADSTFTLTGDGRRPYYDLWLATRIAEPYLMRWLREGSVEQATLAIELFDRQLRFGPPIESDAVAAALEIWTSRAPAAAQERAQAVHARALAPPPAP